MSPSELAPPFAPLPVRARGTLEIFDTAFKLFRRYAGVLMAWSALSVIINLIPVVGWSAYIFTMPLLYGAVSCVVAGAVRGQDVGFKQVWGFTKPRYGALLGILILAAILMGVVLFALLFAFGMGLVLFTSLAGRMGIAVQIIAWFVGVLGGLVGISFLLALVLGWFNLAPVIACLEDANRGSNALSRAWSLLSGNWRKACGVASILGVASLSVLLIVSGFSWFFFNGGWDTIAGADATSWLSGLALQGVWTLYLVALTPLQAMVGAVFYLDLRTKKEALDLEWTNYAAQPETRPDPKRAPQPPPPPPAFPGSGPPYAPASTLPAMQAPMQPQVALAPPTSAPAFGALPNGAPPTFVSQPNPAPVFGVQPPASPAPASAQLNNGAQPPAFGAPSNGVASPAFGAPSNGVASPAFGAQSPPQPDAGVSGLSSDAPAPSQPDFAGVSAPAPPDSFATFAAQIEAAPAPQSAPVESQSAPTFVAPTSDAVPALSLEPPVEVQNSPALSVEPPATFQAPAASIEPPEPEPSPVVDVAPQPPPPGATSSFAPPPRFRRAPRDDDDNPSSFGGGAR